jgi:hypothetical protein
VFPGRTVGRREDRIGERPVQHVVRACETDDGGARLIAGTGIGTPRREILAVDLEGFAVPCRFLSRRIELMARLYLVYCKLGSRGPTRAVRVQ